MLLDCFVAACDRILTTVSYFPWAVTLQVTAERKIAGAAFSPPAGA